MTPNQAALRLADALETPGADFDALVAATELRRLVAENEALRTCARKYLGWLNVHQPAKSLEEDLLNPEMTGNANSIPLPSTGDANA